MLKVFILSFYLAIVVPPIQTPQLCAKDNYYGQDKLRIPVKIGTMIMSTEGDLHKEYYLQGIKIINPGTHVFITVKPIINGTIIDMPYSMFSPLYEIRMLPIHPWK